VFTAFRRTPYREGVLGTQPFPPVVAELYEVGWRRPPVGGCFNRSHRYSLLRTSPFRGFLSSASRRASSGNLRAAPADSQFFFSSPQSLGLSPVKRRWVRTWSFCFQSKSRGTSARWSVTIFFILFPFSGASLYQESAGL